MEFHKSIANLNSATFSFVALIFFKASNNVAIESELAPSSGRSSCSAAA